jgi:bacterioferritin-associated ferredoxin
VFACICAAVSEREVRAVVEEGADTVFEVGCLTRAGTGCGGCHRRIDALINAQRASCPAREHVLV